MVKMRQFSSKKVAFFFRFRLSKLNLVDLAGAVAILLFAQLVVVTLFAIFVIFRIMGKNYDAAVIAGGSFGLFLGIEAEPLI